MLLIHLARLVSRFRHASVLGIFIILIYLLSSTLPSSTLPSPSRQSRPSTPTTSHIPFFRPSISSMGQESPDDSKYSAPHGQVDVEEVPAKDDHSERQEINLVGDANYDLSVGGLSLEEGACTSISGPSQVDPCSTFCTRCCRGNWPSYGCLHVHASRVSQPFVCGCGCKFLRIPIQNRPDDWDGDLLYPIIYPWISGICRGVPHALAPRILHIDLRALHLARAGDHVPALWG